MAALLEVILKHFQPDVTLAQTDAVLPDRVMESGANEGSVAQAAAEAPGRVIVFTNRRDSVQSIVEMLRTREPVITSR